MKTSPLIKRSPTLKSSLALTLLVTALAGCAGLGAPARPALPEPGELRCCWQSQEQVRVGTGRESQTLLAAVAVTPGKLTLVAFDSLGRQLVTLVHEGGEARTLAAPPGWSNEMSRQLLLAVYLHNLAPHQWRFDDPHWVVTQAGTTRTLSHRKRDMVRLHYAVIEPEAATEVTAAPRRIDYVGRDITLDIVTLSRTELPSARPSSTGLPKPDPLEDEPLESDP